LLRIAIFSVKSVSLCMRVVKIARIVFQKIIFRISKLILIIFAIARKETI
jgi:hypothetical protein